MGRPAYENEGVVRASTPYATQYVSHRNFLHVLRHESDTPHEELLLVGRLDIASTDDTYTSLSVFSLYRPSPRQSDVAPKKKTESLYIARQLCVQRIARGQT